MAAEEEKATRGAGSAFGARGPAIPAVAAVGTSGLLILTLWLWLSIRSAPKLLLLGEPLPPPLLSPGLVLAPALVLLSPEPLPPRGKHPWRKKGCDSVAAGSGSTELDEDKTETERGWPRAGCIVLREAACCTLPATPASEVLPGSGSSEIWTGVARTVPAWVGGQLTPPPQPPPAGQRGEGQREREAGFGETRTGFKGEGNRRRDRESMAGSISWKKRGRENCWGEKHCGPGG